MTKNQKLILGVGAIALAYWLFKDKIKEVITLSPPKGNNSYSKPKQGQSDSKFSNLVDNSGNLKFCPPNTNEVYRRGRCTCVDANGTPRGTCGRFGKN